MKPELQKTTRQIAEERRQSLPEVLAALVTLSLRGLAGEEHQMPNRG
jgi:hypothetical protein